MSLWCQLMKMPPRILFPLLCALLMARAQAKLNVVASTPDFGAIAQEIGGDRIELSTLARPTEDPHFVDAKPSFIVKLNRADALIEGGAELEAGWLPSLLDGARNPKLDTGKPGRIACADGISLLEVPSTLDRSKGDIHAAGNPHYMTDPMNGKRVAERITGAFCQLDPKSCDYFQANLRKFEEQLDTKLAEWQRLFLPYKGRAVVTYHNYWIYYGRRFGFPMELFLEPKPGIPPTSAHLAGVITQMKSGHLKVIIVQPYQNRRTAEVVASHTDAVVVDFASFPAHGQGYLDWMDDLGKALAKGFEAAK